MEDTAVEAHRFACDGHFFEVRFERTPEGWIGRISRDGAAEVQVIAFPDGAGFDPDDVRGSLIAGCEAAVQRIRWPAPTHH
ncbi:hypothetical protein OCOJLMKI_5139 [Methylobacterium iners]|uniref:Uncharacterized protein n=1 Tax=Methylobacterium iners TaxID=418707 RepID=A0ABQ4S5R7_9HYPH|nr:hypothetical protein OCOJLMKI_5139 [Methylobacterium iners]